MIKRFISKLDDSDIALNFKLYSLLNMIYIVLEIAIFDCEKVFKDFNGLIKKIIQEEND